MKQPIYKYQLSPENLKTTTMVFELKAVKLEHTPVVESKSADNNLLLPAPDCPRQVFYDIVGCHVAAETDGYRTRYMSWRPFTVISDWGRKFLLWLSSSVFNLPPILLTFRGQMIPAPTMP